MALAAILLGGRKYWVSIFFGAFAGAVWAGETPAAAALLAVCAVIEALLGAWLLNRKAGFDVTLGSAADFYRVFGMAGVIGAAVGALLGVIGLLLVGGLGTESIRQALVLRWMGDALGIILVAPLTLIWRQPPRLQGAAPAEAALLAVLYTLMGQVVFLDWGHGMFGQISRGYWMFLPATWAAIRVGPHGLLLLLLVSAIQSLGGVAHNVGFFAAELAGARMANLWAFTMILTLVGMSLTTLLAERQRAAEALAEREASYRAVIETAADGFWMVDDGGRIRAVNETYARRSGYSRDELLKMNVADLEIQESAAEVLAHIEKIRREGSDTFETRHRTRNGEIWPVEVTVAYWSAVGGRYFVFLRDLAPRRRIEAALQAAQAETEQLIKQQVAQQTVAAIAHELNQPLNAVSAYGEAALRLLRAGNRQPDKLQHALEGNVEQAQRAGKVVRELLAFLSQGVVETEPVDLNATVRAVFERVAQDHEVTFHCQMDLDPGLRKVSVNRLQIEKVLLNLIENGLDAVRDIVHAGKTIEVMVRTSSEASHAQVTVRDSGPGVDASIVHRVFEPFFTTKPRGLGMGLAISRSIIEAHGGQLWVDSEPGSGASFHFTLPFAS